MAATVEDAIGQIHAIQNTRARRQRRHAAALADDRAQIAEGLDRPRRSSMACKIEGTFRAHQVPILVDGKHPDHVKLLESWMKSYRAEELFDANGTLKAELAALAPKGARRMGANPHANGGILLRDLRMPDFRDHAVQVPRPAPSRAGHAGARKIPARRHARETRTSATSASSAPTRRYRICSATSSRSPIASGTPARSRATSFSRPPAAWSIPSSASINARDGWRAIC
jgi:hypothetical protein